MKKTIAPFLLAALLGGLLTLPAQPAFAVAKEIIQLQTQIQALQDQMSRMQQSFDERMGVMRSLIEQSTDNMNKINASLMDLQRTLQQQHTDAGTRSDQISGQVQALNDGLAEVKAQLLKVGKQLDDIKAAQTNLPAAAPGAPGQPGQPGAVPPGGMAANPAPVAPPPDVLYNNALRDYNAAQYDLASQEFSDYLKFYPNTDLAGNAQFYLADMEYRQGNFEQAVGDYEKVIQQYPEGNKVPAAQLKKGMALAKLGRRSEAVKTFNSLVQSYPRTLEAQQAREQLHQLNAGVRTRRPQ